MTLNSHFFILRGQRSRSGVQKCHEEDHRAGGEPEELWPEPGRAGRGGQKERSREETEAGWKGCWEETKKESCPGWDRGPVWTVGEFRLWGRKEKKKQILSVKMLNSAILLNSAEEFGWSEEPGGRADGSLCSSSEELPDEDRDPPSLGGLAGLLQDQTSGPCRLSGASTL